MRNLLLLLLCLSSVALAEQHKAVAIIIDDLGHNYRRGNQALTLEGAFTYAILPQTRYSKKLAIRAYRLGKEVMVHVPMESIGKVPNGIDGDGLEQSMSRKDFDKILGGLVDSIPFAKGVNNHQGSFLTQQYKEMHWLMDEVNKRKMYFIDSRTTHETVATNVASVRNIFSATRDVFLDVEQTEYFVDQSFRKLMKIADRNGTAIAIGHPHKVTIRYLRTAEKKLLARGIDLVPASNLIALQKIREITFALSRAK